MKYRVFVEDVGPGRFSGYSRDVEASSSLDAIFSATGVLRSSLVGIAWRDGSLRPSEWEDRLIALPHNRMDLWPDGKTGKVPAEALEFCKEDR